MLFLLWSRWFFRIRRFRFHAAASSSTLIRTIGVLSHVVQNVGCRPSHCFVPRVRPRTMKSLLQCAILSRSHRSKLLVEVEPIHGNQLAVLRCRRPYPRMFRCMLWEVSAFLWAPFLCCGMALVLQGLWRSSVSWPIGVVSFGCIFDHIVSSSSDLRYDFCFSTTGIGDNSSGLLRFLVLAVLPGW